MAASSANGGAGGGDLAGVKQHMELLNFDLMDEVTHTLDGVSVAISIKRVDNMRFYDSFWRHWQPHHVLCVALVWLHLH